MADQFAKTRPWRATLNRAVTITIGALVIEEPQTGHRQEIAPAYEMPMAPGERMFRRKADATAFVESYRRDHGASVVSDVYKAGV